MKVSNAILCFLRLIIFFFHGTQAGGNTGNMAVVWRKTAEFHLNSGNVNSKPFSRKKEKIILSCFFMKIFFKNPFLWSGDAKVAAQSLEEMLRVSPDLRTLAQLVLAYAKFDLKQVTS